MKKLIYLLLFFPLFATAQINGTIQKTVATGTIRGSFGSSGVDTIPSVTGAFTNGYILKYNSTLKKWYASPDGYIAGLQDSLTKKANRTFDNVASGAIANVKLANSTISGVALGSNLNALTLGNGLTGTSYNGSANVTATADTAVVQTVLNFFPKGDTRYLKGTGNGVTSVTGTANQITVTGTTAPVLSIPSSFITPGTIRAMSTMESGSTGIAGKLSFRRSSDGALASSIEQTNDNKLTLTSSGGTSILDVVANSIDFNSSASLATYYFGQNRPPATQVLINGSNNNKLRIQNNEVDAITLNSSGGTITASSFGSSGDVIVGANNTGLAGKITVGSGLSLTSGVLTATGGSSGSVTTAGGTAGRIAKFTSASNVENSIITEAGSVISIAGDAETSGTNGFSAKSLLIGTDGTIANYRWQTSLSVNDEIFASRSFGTVRTTNYTTGATVYSGAISATNLSGTNTGDQTTITGNAGTATALQTARTISGTSFDGTANITLNNTGITNGAGYITSSALSPYAPLASPALTGTPTAPTATAGTNTTQLATTAFVQSAVSGTASSGTYTPTVASVTNTSAFTVYNSHYIRVGNEVTVMVQVEANSTTTGAGSFSVSLPVASNMTAFTDLSGTGSTNGSFTINPVITGDAVSDLAIVEFTKGAVGSNRFFLTFMYTVR